MDCIVNDSSGDCVQEAVTELIGGKYLHDITNTVLRCQQDFVSTPDSKWLHEERQHFQSNTYNENVSYYQWLLLQV